MQNTADSAVRSTRDGPFAWLSKAALRRIRNRFAESDRVPVAISVYVALCVIASDRQSQEFTVPIALLASLAGVSYKTALGYLRELESAGLVAIRRTKAEGTKLDAPSTYTLLRVCSSDTAPLCSSDIAVCNGGFDPTVTDILEELSSKKTQKKTRRQPAARSGRKSEAFSEETIRRIYKCYPREKRHAEAPTSSEEKAIRKALADLASRGEPDPAAALLNALKAYASYAKRQPPHFRQSFHNFFRQERYFEFLRSNTETNNPTNHSHD